VVVRRGYGFFLPAFDVSIFFEVSIFIEVSIFMPVSVAAAAGAGAGAIAGVAVSFAASSDFEQAVAVTASTAATKARRFMTIS
jgi:fructose-1-phosphate kinase PfkB-like protein